VLLGVIPANKLGSFGAVYDVTIAERYLQVLYKPQKDFQNTKKRAGCPLFSHKTGYSYIYFSNR
jgi:hypothetical protein